MMEALGLAIFMISACFFAAVLESKESFVHQGIPGETGRNLLMGAAMGLTALFIFYFRFTAPSGSQINPAVTLAFLRAGKINRRDAFFYIVFQFIGGTAAVYGMQLLLGDLLTAQPVNSVATVPHKGGIAAAFFMELFTAFAMMTMVLFTSAHERWKKYTRLIAATLVCLYLIIAGPVSGFGMNPARSFASALPAHTWTAFWIYLIAPIAGMLGAAELFLHIQKKKRRFSYAAHRSKNNLLEPLEFVI